jgi:hypothetical protein
VWAGSPLHEIQVADVESWLTLQFSLYPNAIAVIDTLGQMLGTSQKFEKEGHHIIRFQYRGGKQNALMLTTLRSFLTNRRLRFAIDCGMHGGGTLASELKEVVGKELIYGERINHKAGFHDDLTVSLGMGLLAAIQFTTPGPVPQKNDMELHRKEYNGGSVRSNPLDRAYAAKRGLFGLNMPHS